METKGYIHVSKELIPNVDSEKVRHMYNIENYRIADIGKIYGVSSGTTKKYMVKHNIEARPKGMIMNKVVSL